jgi:hypothetical protein
MRCGGVVAVSTDQESLVTVDWSDKTEPTAFEKLPDWKQRRRQRLVIEFYTAIRAYEMNPATPENSPSFTNCDCSPTPGGSAATDADTADRPSAGSSSSGQSTSTAEEQSDEAVASERSEEANVEPLLPAEREVLKTVMRMGVEDMERAVDIVRGGGERHLAILEALERDQERQWKVLALLDRDEVSHAKKLALCGRQSTQLECGQCGSDDNFVPMTCDSRLCPDCNDRTVGQNIEKYRQHVYDMDRPTFMTFTVQNVSNAVSGWEQMKEDFGALRRRTIPFEGEVEREDDDGNVVTHSWSWWEGTAVEDIQENHTQWKVELQSSGQHDLVRRLQQEYVNYEYTNITGTHTGRNIPWDELVSGGLYGVDIKQKGPSEFNVHLHVLADAAYVPQAALSAEWEDITGDPVVDVRRVYDRSSDESVENVLMETVGYAVKPPEFEELESEVEFTLEAKGCPTVHPFGDLHGHGSKGEVAGLICSDCDRMPEQWKYLGSVTFRIDNMGKSWETDRGKDPPE